MYIAMVNSLSVAVLRGYLEKAIMREIGLPTVFATYRQGCE